MDVITAALRRFWRETAAAYPRWTPAARLVVGVSGGPDSTALWHALAHADLHPTAQLTVAYLDHGLRPAADAEANYVAALARDGGSRFYTERVDVPALARETGMTLEEAAREARYDFLARAAAAAGAAFVLVAHHADDQAETVLMHLLRGAGMAGLRGMLPAGPLPRCPQVTLLRPLLTVTRADVVAYCRHHHLHPLTDESNLDTQFYRNRLRHDLLPYLATFNPQVRDRLTQLAALMAADFELLRDLAAEQLARLRRRAGDGWLELDLARWQALPLALRRGVLRLAVSEICPMVRDVGFRALELARQAAETGVVGKMTTLPAGITLHVGYDTLMLRLDGAAPTPTLPQLTHVAPQWLTGAVSLAHGWMLAVERLAAVDVERVRANPDPWQAVVQLPPGASLWLRGRRPGERFQPLGLGGRSQSVKEAMIDRKMPASLRPHWPLVTTADHLVWIVGHQLDERARVRYADRPAWRLRCYRRPQDWFILGE